MCLATTKKETEDFRNKNQDKEFIWAYKLYEIYEGKLYPVWYHRYCSVKPGEIKSDRSRLSFDKRDEDYWTPSYPYIYNSTASWSIRRGIHVYNYKQLFNKNKYRMVRVRCFMSDFVACNGVVGEMVFRKVHLSEKEYNKAIEGE